MEHRRRVYNMITGHRRADRRVTTVRQLELMMDFLQAHRKLALGIRRHKEGRAEGNKQWQDCANILNAADGPARSAKEWIKVWNDFKCKVRMKLLNMNANQQETGKEGGSKKSPVLTKIEEKAARIIMRPKGSDVVIFASQDAKEDNANISDSVEGTFKEITPIEDLVLDMTDEGPPSPNFEGIWVEDTQADISVTNENSNADNMIPGSSDSENEIVDVDTGNAPISSEVKTSHKKLKRLSTENSSSYEENEINLKKKKLELENLVLQNHKIKLEIIEMERRMNIPPSKFTIDLLRDNNLTSANTNKKNDVNEWAQKIKIFVES